MEEANSEIIYFCSKLGLSSQSEKQDFSTLYNYIFITVPTQGYRWNPRNPEILAKMMQGDRRFESSSSSSKKVPVVPKKIITPGTRGWESVPPIPEILFDANKLIEPEILSFQSVFRKLYRKSYYIDLSTAFPAAEAQFQKCVEEGKVAHARLTHEPAYTQKEMETLCSQMTTQKEWIKQVNEWRKDSFRKAAREDAERDFKYQLSKKFPLDPLVMNYYAEEQVCQFGNDLKATIVADFLDEFPSFEEKSDQLAKWAEELRQELFWKLHQTLDMNRKIMEKWEKLANEAIIKYKEAMTTFLEKHPLVGKQRLELFHNKEKNVAEPPAHGFAQSPKYPAWKAALESKVNQEFRILEARRKAERDGKIVEFLQGVRADAGKRYREIFKSNLGPGDDLLDRLTCQQVSDALDRNLDKADELLGSMMEEGVNQRTQKTGPRCSKWFSSGSSGGASKRAKW